MEQTITGAEDVRWDLSGLYTDESTLHADVARTQEEAAAFATEYRGKLSELSAVDLAQALDRYQAIQECAGRAYTYVYLHWSTSTLDASRGALLQKVREACTQISQQLLFFELEWLHLSDEEAARCIEDAALATYRHYLERERLVRDYVLSEKEEKILVETSVTGSGAWSRFFTETMGAMRFDWNGQPVPQQIILSKLYESDREMRRQAAYSFTEGLKAAEHTLTFVFNTLLADKAFRDRLRGYPHWIKSRNLSNEVPDETVEALIDAVTSRYDLLARFYCLKRKLLGLDELFDYDRYASVGESDTRYTWQQARTMVLSAYSTFHPRMGEIASMFFDGRWIDAPVVPGKRGGAFSHGAVPGVHPYILVNYTGKTRDVQTLAHELGHGVHQYLSRVQGYLQANTPLTTAEMASVFGEMLVFERLMQKEADPRNRLAILVSKIDDTLATVFRQIAMNRFEDRIHTIRRERGELSAEQFGDVWMQTQEKMFQGSVTLGTHYRSWWSYIPHFLHTPGYVYAYAFGELLVLALYACYQEDKEVFPERYLGLLKAGGSDWPHILVGQLGIDLNDLSFWHRGLGAIEHMIKDAEELSGQL